MEIDLSLKYNYKLRHKVTGKYYSSGRTATWARPSAIINHLMGNRGWRDINPNEYEVVLFPLESPLSMDATEFIEHYAEENRQKVLRKQREQEERYAREEQRKREDEIRVLKVLQQKYPNV